MQIKFVTFILLFHSLAVLANSSYLPNDGLARRALIIGNGDYQHLPELENPVNDARDIGKTLTALGFIVDIQLDASQEVMEDAISSFGRHLTAGGIGLFYYAGHGIQANGINYMIPSNAELKQLKDLKYKAVNVGQLLDEMDEARNGLNIVILDACRDNPFKEFRSAGRGLAKVKAPKGTLVAFATSPDSVASDGADKNGTYTKHLLQQLKTPGLSVEQVFKKVLQGVDQETKGAQIPWTSSSFTGDFYFIAPQGDANLIQSQAPITIPESSTDNPQILWIAVTTFLLFTTLISFYFYKLKTETSASRHIKNADHNHAQNPVQSKLVPDLNSLEDAQAAGYLVDLKSNKAIAIIMPGKKMILGRSQSRSDVYLANTAISAEHAALQYHSGSHCFLLEDLHSSNNTWIKGQAPLQGGIKTVVKPEQIFYLADKVNAFYIFVPNE